MRIATPVCALARNDKFGTFSAVGDGFPGPYGMSAAGQAHTVRPYSEVTRGMSDTVLVPTAGTSRYLA